MRLSLGALVVGSLLPLSAWAQSPRPELGPSSADEPAPALEPGRSGFYMRFAPRAGLLWVWSGANIMTGFLQPLKSRATAEGFGFEYQIGREIVSHVALAFALDADTFRDVRVEVAGQRVAMRGFQLQRLSVGALVTVFPSSDLGWHTSGKLAWSGLEAAYDDEPFFAYSFGEGNLRGPLLVGNAGYEWRLSRNWWVGFAAYANYSWMRSLDGGPLTRALSSGLMASFTFH